MIDYLVWCNVIDDFAIEAKLRSNLFNLLMGEQISEAVNSR
jgi:hypothetical protein